MLDTDFDALLKKTIDVLASLLSKTNLVFEDKIIIENAISIIMGTILYKKDLFSHFLNFTKEDGPINSAE